MDVQPLPPEVLEKLVQNGKIYREAKAAGDYALAEAQLLASWDAFPEPKHSWDSSESVTKTIAGYYIERKNFSAAETWVKELFKCDPLPSDPKPYLLLGKIYYESGRHELAAQNLIKAYEMGGRRGYASEDPKYLKFALDQIKKASK
ncbi:hypothetical protein [Paracidovorax cattleyae]|uniref:Tetratricopeptide repeat-containing protein n=1 Tax=Paracidovorax cattleyae TaxID=80868 RepID=A0A1H0S7V9_9BURK|nr:hypothetical protein [Paracidovorax cattleyae]MBF9264490.1 hypothetical protein [Paracidovorax cattleyae]SDP37832.1 hypothetical protein SAMN04489708_111159 [Paracidovorax cattleyae]